MSDSELACVYSALILHDAGVQITVSVPSNTPASFKYTHLHIPFFQADKMTQLIKAAGVEVEPIWTTLFARALEGRLWCATNDAMRRLFR